MSAVSNNSYLSNTMEEEYRNSRYDDFQPGSRVEEKQQFRILIKNFSEHLTTDGIRNLCSNYGNVLDVHKPKNSHSIAFINLSTSVEAEAAVRGINELPGRMIADFAKEKKKEANPFYIKKDPEEMNGHALEYDADRKIDMNARKIKGPFSAPYKQIAIKPKPFVTDEDYNGSALKSVDPQREFLVESDAYEKERYLAQHNSHRTPDVNHLNRTNMGGRSLFVENVDVVEKARNMSMNSNGGYNKSNDSFDYNSTFLEESFYSGSCIKCTRKAIGTCEVCGAFYCSANCQHDDWPAHRIGCGVPRLILKNKSPGKISFTGKGNLSVKLISPSTSKPRVPQEPPVQQKENIVEKEILIEPVTVDGSCPVIITAVIDGRTVFVRPTSHDSEYLKAIEDITEYSRRAANMTILPQKGDVILSKFEGVYYRALVLNTVNKFSVRVAYIEYGNMEIKNLVDLKKLAPELQGIPRFIKKLFLKDISSADVKNEKVIDYLSKQMNNLIRLQIISDKSEMKEVELINELTKESLNKIIIDMVTIRPPASFGNYSNFTEMGVPVIPLGRDITVVITDNSQIGLGILSAMNEVELLTLEKLDKQVQDYCNSNESSGYSPRKMEMCLAKFEEDQKWYRAYCVEGGVGDGFISLIFCDFGNMSMVKIEDIKKFPKDMLTPALAATCYIKDFPKNPENLSAQIKSKFTESFECGLKQVTEISKDENGEYVFYFPEVDQILANQ